MPTYEYRCIACGQHVEVVQSFTDEPLTTCGVCSGELRKVFSPVGIVFKGSGFYKTDSRGSKTAAVSKEKKESADSSSSSSSDSSSSKDSSGSSDSSSSSSSKDSSGSSSPSNSGAKSKIA